MPLFLITLALTGGALFFGGMAMGMVRLKLRAVITVFLGGISGQIYRQFALTIAASVLLSAFNALSLSPALSALIASSMLANGEV